MTRKEPAAVGATGTTLSTADLDPHRRKLLFRAWHRGTREMDLIMGTFADNQLPILNDNELVEFERLIDMPDRDLFSMICGTVAVPHAYNTPLFTRLMQLHNPQ